MRKIGIALIAIWVVLLGVIFIHWDTEEIPVDPNCGAGSNGSIQLLILCKTNKKSGFAFENRYPDLILPSLALPVVGAGLIALSFTKSTKPKKSKNT